MAAEQGVTSILEPIESVLQTAGLILQLLTALVVFLEEDWYYGIEVINEHTLSTV